MQRSSCSRLFILIAIMIAMAMATSCSGGQNDRRLKAIAAIVSDAPLEALSKLDSICSDSLSDADRHFYNFLRIKAADKAYITHQSDSLIRDVLDYYSSHHSGLYPEVLYYGGRVYSDLGNYPTALEYFHKAADITEDDPDNIRLRGTILSQTGRLLLTLRLYDEAIPNIEQSIIIDRNFNDSVNEVHNLLLLGQLYLRKDDYRKADSIITIASEKSRFMDSIVRSQARMDLASSKYELGENDAALELIRNTVDHVHHLSRNEALAIAVETYQKAGKIDSAFLFLRRLLESDYDSNKPLAYHILFSPEFSHRIDPDSLGIYARNYHNLLEEISDSHEDQLAISQQSMHNYQLHVRQREKAEMQNRRLILWISGISLVALVAIIVALALKNINSRNVIKLHETLENIEILKKNIAANAASATSGKAASEKREIPDATAPLPAPEPSDNEIPQNSTADLRKRLRDELIAMSEDAATAAPVVDNRILISDAYAMLMNLISEGKTLEQNDPLWKDLEKTVLECSPKFKENFTLLAGRFKVNDFNIALLVKCGIAPSKMAILLNRTKGTISSRREYLCNVLLGEKLGTRVFDHIIRQM